jgi:hypothetical protein
MDEFTKRHLHQFCEVSVYEDERDEFEMWALAAVTDDPDYDWNWPSLYRSFRLELAQ